MADRVDLRPYHGTKPCESFRCVRRALWLMEFHGEVPTLLSFIGTSTTMLACGSCARQIADGLRADSALIVFHARAGNQKGSKQ